MLVLLLLIWYILIFWSSCDLWLCMYPWFSFGSENECCYSIGLLCHRDYLLLLILETLSISSCFFFSLKLKLSILSTQLLLLFELLLFIFSEPTILINCVFGSRSGVRWFPSGEKYSLYPFPHMPSVFRWISSKINSLSKLPYYLENALWILFGFVAPIMGPYSYYCIALLGCVFWSNTCDPDY